MLEQGEILTLNDNKVYSVVFSTIYKEKNYVYIIDQTNRNNGMFCCHKDNSLEQVVDQNIITELLKKFVKKINQ